MKKRTRRVPEGYPKGAGHTHTHNVHLSTCRVCVFDIHKGESYATVSMTVTLKAGARKFVVVVVNIFFT